MMFFDTIENEGSGSHLNQGKRQGHRSVCVGGGEVV